MLLCIKSVKITNKGQISIPKEIREIKGFKEGEKIAMFAFENKIEIKPLNEVDEAYILSEEALGEAWNSKEDEEAWKDL